MKTWMKTSIAAAVIATAGLGTTAALAWGGHGHGPHGGKAGWSQMEPAQVKQRMAQRVELQMARLELALALSAEQKPAFETFKNTMKARAERMAETMAAGRAEARPATAIERMQRMEEAGKLRLAEMAETRKAVETFYGTLGSAQKTVFDAEFQKAGRHDFGKKGDRGPGKGERGMREPRG
ncbi:Spy/CpxP family protein refolding chaperone [Thauera sp. SDU_THAU2]|uniref:Spy/CpxP family protein refolding chaperone n=1 Tax=Thauera sp. SDU_THAU2 TaxID=3136633 RepID=UPI00311E1A1A